MKNFTSILVFLLIVCTVSAQKKSSSAIHNSHRHNTSRSVVHTSSPHKPSGTHHKPSRNSVSSSTSGGNASAHSPVNNAHRTDIKPSAVPTAAATEPNTNPAISRVDLVSDGSSNVATENPDSPETTNQPEINYNYKFAFCNTNSYQTLRCNRRWYRYWYRYKAFDCNWTGDVTFVNTTDTTLVLYVQQRDAETLPTITTTALPSLADQQNYNNLEILPGDSLTFKMPCGGLQYEVVQKREKRKSGKLRNKMGWVRSVSTDVRVEIKEEELE
jgi:hypothetical protein